jgi:carboxyl-terminal processing protease
MNLPSIPRGRFQHFTVALVVTLIFFVGFALGNQYGVGKAQSATSAPPDAEQAFQPFWQVYNLIQSEYIDKVDTAKLVDGATKGLVDALGDQFSGYMNPELYKLVNSDLTGEFNGIGVIIHTDDKTGEITVVGLLDGAPAAAAGIQPGDIFTAVNDTDVTGMNQTDLAALVRGAEGTNVKITVERGDQSMDFNIKRAHITVPNIESKVLDDNVGYIKLNQFTASARQDLDNALAAIDVNNRAGLILDLRDNPGGLLTAAIDVGSAFIKSGTVVTEDFGHGNTHVYEATGNYVDIKVPIAVLVNGGSASASELLTGALQDDHLATVIGAQSFGKGTVQSWQDLVNGGGIRLTIAKWLTPTGRWIHKVGITPDIIVDWTPTTYDPTQDDPQLDAAQQFLEGKPVTEVIAQATEQTEATQPSQATPEETPAE